MGEYSLNHNMKLLKVYLKYIPWRVLGSLGSWLGLRPRLKAAQNPETYLSKHVQKSLTVPKYPKPQV